MSPPLLPDGQETPKANQVLSLGGLEPSREAVVPHGAIGKPNCCIKIPVTNVGRRENPRPRGMAGSSHPLCIPPSVGPLDLPAPFSSASFPDLTCAANDLLPLCVPKLYSPAFT